ncbi:MAG: hypothetical protein R3F29_01740 [Planctomycetota bacterium]
MNTIKTLLIAGALTLLSSCTAEVKNDPQTAPKPETPAAPNPAVAAILAKADAVDGTTDKVVHKCAGCALHMDGKAEHAIAIEGYTMHFCKPACYDRFKADTAGEVLKLKID